MTLTDVVRAGVVEVELTYNLPAFDKATTTRGYVKEREMDALLEAVAKGQAFKGDLLAFPAMSAIVNVRTVSPLGRSLAAQAK